MQQKIATHSEAMEIVMKLEASLVQETVVKLEASPVGETAVGMN